MHKICRSEPLTTVALAAFHASNNVDFVDLDRTNEINGWRVDVENPEDRKEAE